MQTVGDHPSPQQEGSHFAGHEHHAYAPALGLRARGLRCKGPDCVRRTRCVLMLTGVLLLAWRLVFPAEETLSSWQGSNASNSGLLSGATLMSFTVVASAGLGDPSWNRSAKRSWRRASTHQDGAGLGGRLCFVSSQAVPTLHA